MRCPLVPNMYRLMVYLSGNSQQITPDQGAGQSPAKGLRGRGAPASRRDRAAGSGAAPPSERAR
jgi:hypothetical protein